MSHGDYEFDVTHTFAAHLFFGDFDTATVADDTLITDTFVLTAMALIVLDGAEDFLAEKAIALRLVSAIVDGFRL